MYVFHFTDGIHCSVFDMSSQNGSHFYEVALTIVYMTD